MCNGFKLVRAYYPICTIKIEISIISTFVGRYVRGYWIYNWLTYTSSFYLIIFISHVNPWARITTSVSINRVNTFPGGTQDNAERGLVFEHYEFNTRALVFSRVTEYDSISNGIDDLISDERYYFTLANNVASIVPLTTGVGYFYLKCSSCTMH